MMWLKMWLRKNLLISCLLVGLLALFSWWYFEGLGSYAFFDWDESIYAQIAKHSHHFPDLEWLGYSGDLGKQIWFEKPPLQIWLIQLSFRVFGVTEFAARIPSVVYGLLSILIAYFFSKSLSASRLHGILSVLSFALIGGFAFGVGYVGMDIAVGFWIFLALFAFWRSRENTKFWYLFWCALAFGFLTKSVVGLLPLPIILTFSALDCGSHKYRWLKNKDFWLGFVLFLAISSPWVIYESLHYGKAFWDSFLLIQVLSRFATGLQDSNTGPWNFYFSIFSPQPFGFLGLASLLFVLWEFCKKRFEMLLPFVSIVFIFLFFSLSRTKILWYVSMVYPLFTVLIGYGFYSLIVRVKWRWLKYLSLSVLVLICVWFGVVFQKSKLVILQEQRYADIRRIGEFLKGDGSDIYYISLYGSDMITQSYPALVYYSGQYVKEVSRDFVDWKNQKSIFRTPTHQVYKINGDFYVVAVRYYP